jgi:hypothetical protein
MPEESIFTTLERLPETAVKTAKALPAETAKALELLKSGKVLKIPAGKKIEASALSRAVNRELYGSLKRFENGRMIVERYIDKADKAILLKAKELTKTDWDNIVKNREAAKKQARKPKRT